MPNRRPRRSLQQLSLPSHRSRGGTIHAMRAMPGSPLTSRRRSTGRRVDCCAQWRQSRSGAAGEEVNQQQAGVSVTTALTVLRKDSTGSARGEQKTCAASLLARSQTSHPPTSTSCQDTLAAICIDIHTSTLYRLMVSRQWPSVIWASSRGTKSHSLAQSNFKIFFVRIVCSLY
jgi:hypothetical protein